MSVAACKTCDPADFQLPGVAQPPIFMDSEACCRVSCRICFEDVKCAAEVIAPCRCKGTQKWVHPKCLETWQVYASSRKSHRDERATRCSVCRGRYSTVLGQPAGRGRAFAGLRRAAGMCAVCMLAFALSGPPWPQLAVALCLLLVARCSALVCCAAVCLACVVATLHLRGLRVVMRLDESRRLGLAVVRFGEPVDGLGPGVLLAGSPQLNGTYFGGAAVLVTHHGAGGAEGVVLNRPLAPHAAAPGPSPLPTIPGASVHELAGGPVGEPGRRALSRRSCVLHTLGGAVGAKRLLSAPGARASHHTSFDDASCGGLFYSNMLAGVAEAAWEAADAARPRPAPPQPARGADTSSSADAWWTGGMATASARLARGPGGGGEAVGHCGGAADGGDLSRHAVLVFHGVCSWGPGQLEGEVRAGAWGFTPARVAEVLGPQRANLWTLLRQEPGRLRWLGRR